MPDRVLPTLSSFVAERIAVKPFRPLTPQQERVADLVARGWGAKAIAARLRISPRTVEHYIEEIAALLPDDDLSPQDRVQLWALCVEISKLHVSSGDAK